MIRNDARYRFDVVVVGRQVGRRVEAEDERRCRRPPGAELPGHERVSGPVEVHGAGLGSNAPAARGPLPDHAGLFLAGDWVGPVGMPPDAALPSAAAAARTAAEHLALKSVSQPA